MNKRISIDDIIYIRDNFRDKPLNEIADTLELNIGQLRVFVCKYCPGNQKWRKKPTGRKSRTKKRPLSKKEAKRIARSERMEAPKPQKPRKPHYVLPMEELEIIEFWNPVGMLDTDYHDDWLI